MSTAVATPAPSTSVRARLAAAASRAMAEGLSARLQADGTWACKTYRIVPFGTSAVDVRCDCPAGFAGLVCKHVAPVIFGRKYGLVAVSARTPAPKVVAPSTAEDVAASEAVKAEIIAEMITAAADADRMAAHVARVAGYRAEAIAQRRAGIDPLAEAYA